MSESGVGDSVTDAETSAGESFQDLFRWKKGLEALSCLSTVKAICTMNRLMNMMNLLGLKTTDDSILVSLIGEGREKGYLTKDQLLVLPSEKRERGLQELAKWKIKVIDDESKIRGNATCPCCKKTKPVKFGFYYEKPIRRRSLSKHNKKRRTWTDHCVWCLDEFMCECPAARSPSRSRTSTMYGSTAIYTHGRHTARSATIGRIADAIAFLPPTSWKCELRKVDFPQSVAIADQPHPRYRPLPRNRGG